MDNNIHLVVGRIYGLRQDNLRRRAASAAGGRAASAAGGGELSSAGGGAASASSWGASGGTDSVPDACGASAGAGCRCTGVYVHQPVR